MEFTVGLHGIETEFCTAVDWDFLGFNNDEWNILWDYMMGFRWIAQKDGQLDGKKNRMFIQKFEVSLWQTL